MQSPGRTVYVIGAGIAGLTLALALAKFGTTVVVLEKSAELETVGAGIQISPNASRIFDRLGVGRAVKSAAFAPEAIDVYPFRRATPIVSLRLGATIAAKTRAPYFVIHRADLARILHQACRRFANIDMRFGVRSFDVQSHARGLSMIIEDSTGETRTVRPFAVAAADGVHSFTRREILDGPEADYSGYVAWRTMLPIAAMDQLLATKRSSLLWGPGFHAVAYPIVSANEMNIALFTKVKQKQLATDVLTQGPQLPKLWLKSAHFEKLIELAANNWTAWPLYTVNTKTWHDGATGLLGDAAHAMLPFQAQGAAMGIEDAAVLAPLLVTEPDATSAFERYTAMRKKRVNRVVKLSRRNGFAFHLEWPFTIARDTLVSRQGPLAHLERLDWLYSYDPSPEINTAPQRDST